MSLLDDEDILINNVQKTIHPLNILQAFTKIDDDGYKHIDKCDFDNMPMYSDKNIERFKVEAKYRHVRMMEWFSMYDFNMSNPDATYDEKIRLAKERREEDRHNI